MNKNKPNLVLRNGSIYTVDSDRSWAQAIAIAGDKIVYVGTDKRYLTELLTGQTVLVRIQNSSKKDISAFPKGAEAQISWTPEDARLLTD